jgi:D-amino peptidase
MQNLLHTELDPRVTYIQGAVKPFGMVEGSIPPTRLRSSSATIRARHAQRIHRPHGHGRGEGLWLNDIEVGRGAQRSLCRLRRGAGDHGCRRLRLRRAVHANGESQAVATKYAVTPQAARLLHPKVVQERLVAAAGRALANRGNAKPWVIGKPVKVRLRLADNTVTQILQAIPGVRQVDGFTVEFTAPTMADAYRLIRLMYRFVTV